MAVAHDVASESHTGTTGSTSEASFTWNHAGASSGVKGVLVYTYVVNATGDKATSVTYGGVSMTAVTGGRSIDVAGEAGDCKAWYLGTAVPQGTQAVVVNRTNDAAVMYAQAMTVTAAVDTEVNAAGIVLLQGDQALAEQSVSDGSIGINSVRYAGLFSGAASVPSAGANSTALTSIVLAAARIAAAVRETTAGQGARSVGFTLGPSDDVAAVHLAVREIVSGSGAFAAGIPGLAGTGTHTESGATGTGAFAAVAASFAGTGTETFTGTGAPAFAAAVLAGTGAESYTGTGALTAAAPSFAGTGTETLTGTGAFAAAAASLAGAGIFGDSVTGTGAFAAAAAFFAGIGTVGAVSGGPQTSGIGGKRRRVVNQPPIPRPVPTPVLGKGGFHAEPASLHGVGFVDTSLLRDDEELLLLLS